MPTSVIACRLSFLLSVASWIETYGDRAHEQR